MLDVARRIGSPEGAAIAWVQGTGEALPFGDATFDVVLCQQGMQFFIDRLAAVREIGRVLIPGGRVAVSVWRGPEHQSVKGAFLLALRDWFGPGALKPYSFPDGDAVRQLFIDAGFRDVTLEVVRLQHFAPSVDELLTMTIMGASAAVPALAQASVDEKEQAIAEVRERIAADIEAVRVEGGIRYPMESNIVVATV
jgi:SAM-dependent methyltransferase